MSNYPSERKCRRRLPVFPMMKRSHKGSLQSLHCGWREERRVKWIGRVKDCRSTFVRLPASQTSWSWSAVCLCLCIVECQDAVIREHKRDVSLSCLHSYRLSASLKELRSERWSEWWRIWVKDARKKVVGSDGRNAFDRTEEKEASNDRQAQWWMSFPNWMPHGPSRVSSFHSSHPQQVSLFCHFFPCNL